MPTIPVITPEWLAGDRDGHLAALITAGAGPIPVASLGSPQVPIDDLEDRLGELPKVGGARLLVTVKRPDDFITLAERGLFVYDWTDIYRTARDAVNAYEPVAVPTKAITADRLPADLGATAAAVASVECLSPQHPFGYSRTHGCA